MRETFRSFFLRIRQGEKNMKLFTTLRNYKIEYLPKDLFSGIMIAAVSIPIAMGYAQIAGLPAVYGLYGSVYTYIYFLPCFLPRGSLS